MLEINLNLMKDYISNAQNKKLSLKSNHNNDTILTDHDILDLLMKSDLS